INENYKDINAKVELCDENSIYNYYRRLIALRKSNDVIVYGSYTLLLPEDKKLFAYTREYGEHSLLVVCNFTDEKTDFVLPEQFANASLLIANEAAHINDGTLQLCEYGAYVFTK
ncbi:MAG: alpha-glucosidase C-terminal domain-containing protein, partial [Oscillospiraceae bacterium]